METAVPPPKSTVPPPSAVDWDYFLSDAAKRYKPSAIRGSFDLLDTPGILSLLAGEPDPASFPFDGLEVSVKPIDPEAGKSEVIKLDGQLLEDALQYGSSQGYAPLVRWFKTLQSLQHKRDDDGSWDLSIGSGSLDLVTKTFGALINPGDSVLVETPVFAGTLGFLFGQECDLVDVHTDTQGLRPDDLEDTLVNWETKHPGKRFPKLLYTIPTGSNPSGASSPEDRKLKVLELAHKYNLLVLEDDAYHYLFYGTDKVTTRPASYFELEARTGKVGHVVRFDTMSKVLSAGMRIGLLTAAPKLIETITLITTCTSVQPNSLSQAVALAYLSRLGHAGFYEHTQRVAALYKKRRDFFEVAARKHLSPASLATWVQPDCGMFLYLKLNLPNNDSAQLIRETAVKRGVLAVPGVGFSPTKTKSEFVRCSFSLVTEEEAEEAIRRLADTVREGRGELTNGYH